jgi:glutamate synthase domain-containing protein 1
MCGIAGLFLKDVRLEPQLGAMLASMLAVLSDRGPDSAGFALYGAGSAGAAKVTVRAADDESLVAALRRLASVHPAVSVDRRGNHAVLSVPVGAIDSVRSWVAEDGGLSVVGSGTRMEIFKEVGLPSEVARRFDLAAMRGTHAIGHTRMATESAVTTRGAHPFSTGPDQCLVHNGSLSNHNAVRRLLRHEGITFETDNDSEVAAGYLTWRMRQGQSLGQALESSLADLDGFYTFVVGTESGFAVLRDSIACKPAVMAETDGYVAFGSEYRALAVLPGASNARVFEPEPATVYAWERAA